MYKISQVFIFRISIKILQIPLDIEKMIWVKLQLICEQFFPLPYLSSTSAVFCT